jgi:REP element-mobilizing transposase RayT
MKSMKYDPDIHHRRSIRLKEYDYSQAGMYFLTTCTLERASLFGEIVDGVMHPNNAGKIVQTTWNALPGYYTHVALDVFVVMPNHVHGIVVFDSFVGAGFKPALTRCGLSEIVRAFKTFSSRRINEQHGALGSRVWQRNYWERVIRNDEELFRFREYIQNNPMQWELDKLHPRSKWMEQQVSDGI